MKERILVPLDGTSIGEAVIPQLENLVLDSTPPKDTEITLVHVLSIVNFNLLTIDDKAQLPFKEEDRLELYQNAQYYLEKIAGRLRQKGFRVTTEVRMGHAAEEIVKLANEIKANLIAMSTHGYSGIARLINGSVTDTIIRLENKIPVLTINMSREHKENSFFSLQTLQAILKQI
jgi:nucleotide-binding universal stress UspA family protein